MHRLLLAAILLCGSATTAAFAAGGGFSPPDSMAEFGSAKVQPGYVQFCDDYYDGDCGPYSVGSERVALTETLRKKIHEVNEAVNRHVVPVTDKELWGVVDHWSYPVQRDGRLYGDCEDYVLEKRRLLMEMGVPQHVLLITVVLDSDGGGHAVLTVATDEGDLILDNLTSKVLPWHETSYRFVKRQSAADPSRWVSLRRSVPLPEEVPVAGSD